ncbi:MAG: hypothetical protein ACRDE2_00315 [Chitinophagaceae bacterium]
MKHTILVLTVVILSSCSKGKFNNNITNQLWVFDDSVTLQTVNLESSTTGEFSNLNKITHVESSLFFKWSMAADTLSCVSNNDSSFYFILYGSEMMDQSGNMFIYQKIN